MIIFALRDLFVSTLHIQIMNDTTSKKRKFCNVCNKTSTATLLQELRSAKDEIRRLRNSNIITHVAKPFILRAKEFVGPMALERLTALSKWHEGKDDEMEDCYQETEEGYLKRRHCTDPCRRKAFGIAYRAYHDFIELGMAIDVVANQWHRLEETQAKRLTAVKSSHVTILEQD